MTLRLDWRYDLELYDAAAHSDSDRLGAITGSELFHNVLDVDLNCLFGDEQFIGDVPVTISARDLTKDFNLSASESFVAVMFGQICRNLGRNTPLAGMNLADHFN